MQLTTAQNEAPARPARSVALPRGEEGGPDPQNILRALSERRPQDVPAWSPFAYTISLDQVISAARALNVQATAQFALRLDTAVLLYCDESLGVAKFGKARGIEDYIRETFAALARGGDAAASVLRRDGPGVVGDITVVIRSYLYEKLGTPSGREAEWFVWIAGVQKLAKSVAKNKSKGTRGKIADWVLNDFAVECVAIAREAGGDLSLPTNSDFEKETPLLVFARQALLMVAARGLSIIDAFKNKEASQSIFGWSELSGIDQINAKRRFNSYRSIPNGGLAQRLARAKKAPQPAQTKLEICSQLVMEIAGTQGDVHNTAIAI